jgi:glyoxylate carboligase
VSTAARSMVECLENEGVSVVFGLPGEENIRFIQTLAASNIRYVLTRHEQGAAFMAEMYGRVTGRAAVVSATLGPCAINMQLGVADATTNSPPVGRDLGAGRPGSRIQGITSIRRSGDDVRSHHPLGRRHSDPSRHPRDVP